MRLILKQILLLLSKLAIAKHGIRFVVVAGWYGTDLVKEGIYTVLSEKMNVRRNIQEIWWDFSVPLEIMGYKDKRYTVTEWIGIIFRSLVALFVNPRNPHSIILNLDLADTNTTDYWSKLVKPEVLVVINYKKDEGYLIDRLIKTTQSENGKVLVSGNASELSGEKFGWEGDGRKKIYTANTTYDVSENLSPLLLEIYPPIIAIGELFGVNQSDINTALAKFDGREVIAKKIATNIMVEDISV